MTKSMLNAKWACKTTSPNLVFHPYRLLAGSQELETFQLGNLPPSLAIIKTTEQAKRGRSPSATIGSVLWPPYFAKCSSGTKSVYAIRY